MIDVATAEELVKKHSIKLKNESVELERLQGRILSEPIISSREQPPFNRVAMDGIAIRYEYLKNKSFPICGIQKAGMKAIELENKEGAIEVMTGAVLPFGTDTVIPYEKIKLVDQVATVLEVTDVNEAQNIHFQGSDYAKGEVLLEPGLKLNSAAVAIIAGQGLKEASVKKFPKMAIVSTGDELIEPGKRCEPWQIWRSNAFALKSELKGIGLRDQDIELFHLADEKEKVYSALEDVLKKFDGIIISGGVSMGKYDFVQAVMSDLGVEKQFYKIKQKPGKPMFFGTGPKGQAIYALPGNPVSALFCMRRYVIPSLQESFKQNVSTIYVELNEDVSFKKEFSYFKAVAISYKDNGKMEATPLKSNGSGDFSSLGRSDGFIELPANMTIHKAGNSYKFYPWTAGK